MRRSDQLKRIFRRYALLMMCWTIAAVAGLIGADMWLKSVHIERWVAILLFLLIGLVFIGLLIYIGRVLDRRIAETLKIFDEKERHVEK